MITSVRPYFKSIMKSLGFEEYRKSLEPDNVPKSLAKSIFHIKTDTISGVKQNQRDVETEVQVTVSFIEKGGRDEVSAYEAAEGVVQDIVRAALSPTTKAASPAVKRVSFNSATPEAWGVRNDNLLLCRVQFTALVILDV